MSDNANGGTTAPKPYTAGTTQTPAFSSPTRYIDAQGHTQDTTNVTDPASLIPWSQRPGFDTTKGATGGFGGYRGQAAAPAVANASPNSPVAGTSTMPYMASGNGLTANRDLQGAEKPSGSYDPNFMWAGARPSVQTVAQAMSPAAPTSGVASGTGSAPAPLPGGGYQVGGNYSGSLAEAEGDARRAAWVAANPSAPADFSQELTQADYNAMPYWAKQLVTAPGVQGFQTFTDDLGAAQPYEFNQFNDYNAKLAANQQIAAITGMSVDDVSLLATGQPMSYWQNAQTQFDAGGQPMATSQAVASYDPNRVATTVAYR